MTKVRACRAVLGALSLLLVASGACAADYPTRPVTLIVPYAAGGGSDVVARVIAESMSDTLGERVVVENHPGAGATLGTERVAKSPADGYVIGLASSAPMIYASTYFPKVRYSQKDFAPIGSIASSQLLLLARPTLQVNTVEELIAAARKQSEPLRLANGGTGSPAQVASEFFITKAKIAASLVPYRGSNLALMDLLGSHVDALFIAIPSAVGQVKAGNVKALAVTGSKRSSILPDVPTLAETVLPGFEVLQRYGLVAPAGTPPDIVDKLNAALRKALRSDKVLASLERDGAEVEASSPAEYKAAMERERQNWQAIAKTRVAR